MKYDDVKEALTNAARGWARVLSNQHPAEREAIEASMEVISEALSNSHDKAGLLSHLKAAADGLIREDYINGIDTKDESLNNALFCGMLNSVLLTYGKDHREDRAQEPNADGVISLEARRMQRDVLSQPLYEGFACIKQYYRWGFDAMQALNKQLVPGEEGHAEDCNMYGYAYHILRDEHPDLEDYEIGDMIHGHIHAMLQTYLNEKFCAPLGIEPDTIPKAKHLPLHSFLLIAKAYDVAQQHARSSTLPEGSAMFQTRLMREVRPLLKDLLKKDHYQCADAGDFLATMDWLNHSFDMAPKERSRS